MNIYLENNGLYGNIRRLKKCRALIGNDQTAHLHLISSIRVTSIELYLLAFRFSWLKNMTLEITASKLTAGLVSLFNHKPLLTLTIRTDRRLTASQRKRISRISGRIVVIDHTGDEEHETFYQSNRNIVYKGSTHDGISVADAYAACSGTPAIGCTHTSCLGKTLYISRDSTVSYCPYFVEKSKIGKLDSIHSLFNHPNFLATLKRIIDKRNSCKQSCELFPVCRAGCPLSFDCEAFKIRYQDACNDLSKLIEMRAELSSLPLYKEYAVLYKLFGMRRG